MAQSSEQEVSSPGLPSRESLFRVAGGLGWINGAGRRAQSLER